jgi:hypothetical protein
MYPCDLLIALEGRSFHCVYHGVSEPAVQVLFHLQVISVEDEAAIRVRYGLTKSPLCFCLVLPRHVAPPAVNREVGAPVAGDLAFLVAARVDGPRPVAALLGLAHDLPSSFDQLGGLHP